MKNRTKIVVVIRSALELKSGLTRLSGSKPNRKVMNVADKAIRPTKRNDRKLVRSNNPSIEPYNPIVIPLGNIAVPRRLITVTTIKAAVIIPKKLIDNSLLLSDLKDGVIVPKCSLVVLVLAKIELWLPTVLIIAG